MRRGIPRNFKKDLKLLKNNYRVLELRNWEFPEKDLYLKDFVMNLEPSVLYHSELRNKIRNRVAYYKNLT